MTVSDDRLDFALLLRVLHREGYDDHLAGHISFDRGDGTFLVNPLELSWDEVRASDVLVMDANGHKLEGAHRISPAIGLHMAVRRLRSDAAVIVHNHPRWSGVWAAASQIPPVYDQTSAQISHQLVLVDEYNAAVDSADEAADVADAFGDAQWALLAHHGVLVVGTTIAETYLRTVTLEWRCRRAWEVEALDRDAAPLKPDVARSYGERFERSAPPLWWAAARRRELARDKEVRS